MLPVTCLAFSGTGHPYIVSPLSALYRVAKKRTAFLCCWFNMWNVVGVLLLFRDLLWLFSHSSPDMGDHRIGEAGKNHWNHCPSWVPSRMLLRSASRWFLNILRNGGFTAPLGNLWFLLLLHLWCDCFCCNPVILIYPALPGLFSPVGALRCPLAPLRCGFVAEHLPPSAICCAFVTFYFVGYG